MHNKIWLSSPHMGGGELKYIHEAFDQNWIAPLGPNVDNFEKEIANYLGIDHAAALSSGTAAIHLALILSGVSDGDEVLCQSFTFSATTNPILYQRATPVFVDSEAETWNMDPDLLKEAIDKRIKAGKKPKACIVVHLYGMPAQIVRIKEICDSYDITLIEDAAEALGSSIGTKKLGTFGKFGILSFNGNKIITTSGGGALVSNDKEAIEKARFFSTQSRDNAPHYQHSEIGYNYRMSNIAAGIGRGQLEVLDEWVTRRRANFNFYKTSLNFEWQEEKKGYFSNRWLSCALLESFEQRERLRLKLHEKNIETRPLWKPMHLQPIFAQYPKHINGVSEMFFEKGLCFPSGSNLSNSNLDQIVASIHD
jgi:dTDP-4-amino-4,6-dideoxygalactose transaminase